MIHNLSVADRNAPMDTGAMMVVVVVVMVPVVIWIAPWIAWGRNIMTLLDNHRCVTRCRSVDGGTRWRGCK